MARIDFTIWFVVGTTTKRAFFALLRDAGRSLESMGIRESPVFGAQISFPMILRTNRTCGEPLPLLLPCETAERLKCSSTCAIIRLHPIVNHLCQMQKSSPH